MQRTYYVTGSPSKGFRLKNILLSSLLIATSHAYSHDVVCDTIELDDFQEKKSCESQNNETENSEEDLEKHWEKSYAKKENQFIDDQYN